MTKSVAESGHTEEYRVRHIGGFKNWIIGKFYRLLHLWHGHSEELVVVQTVHGFDKAICVCGKEWSASDWKLLREHPLNNA